MQKIPSSKWQHMCSNFTNALQNNKTCCKFVDTANSENTFIKITAPALHFTNTANTENMVNHNTTEMFPELTQKRWSHTRCSINSHQSKDIHVYLNR